MRQTRTSKVARQIDRIKVSHHPSQAVRQRRTWAKILKELVEGGPERPPAEKIATFGYALLMAIKDLGPLPAHALFRQYADTFKGWLDQVNAPTATHDEPTTPSV